MINKFIEVNKNQSHWLKFNPDKILHKEWLNKKSPVQNNGILQLLAAVLNIRVNIEYINTN